LIPFRRSQALRVEPLSARPGRAGLFRPSPHPVVPAGSVHRL